MLAEFGYKPHGGVDVEAYHLWKMLGTKKSNWKRKGWLHISCDTKALISFTHTSPVKYSPRTKFKDVHRYLCKQVQDEVKRASTSQ